MEFTGPVQKLLMAIVLSAIKKGAQTIRMNKDPLIVFFDIGNKNMLGFFDFPGHEHPAWQETIGGVQHLALSIPQEQYDAARKRFDETGFEYLGPDRGVEESMYFRDPNGVGLELYREDLGEFDGHHLID